MAPPATASTPGARVVSNADIQHLLAHFHSPAVLEQDLLAPLVQAAIAKFPDPKANIKLRASQAVLSSSNLRDGLDRHQQHSAANDPRNDAGFYRVMYQNATAEIKRLQQKLNAKGKKRHSALFRSHEAP
ncbi:hypothetical protein BST61_g9658 [Cercospora zeina]